MAFLSLGQVISPEVQTVSALESFECHHYGSENDMFVNILQYKLFNSGKFDEERLLPNRVNYECYIRKGVK